MLHYLSLLYISVFHSIIVLFSFLFIPHLIFVDSLACWLDLIFTSSSSSSSQTCFTVEDWVSSYERTPYAMSSTGLMPTALSAWKPGSVLISIHQLACPMGRAVAHCNKAIQCNWSLTESGGVWNSWGHGISSVSGSEFWSIKACRSVKPALSAGFQASCRLWPLKIVFGLWQYLQYVGRSAVPF